MTEHEAPSMVDFFLRDRLRQGHASRTALIIDREGQPAERLSYAEVAALADRFAHALRAAGVEPEERVLLALEDGPAFVGAFFGVLQLGAVVVMVNPELREEDAAYFFAYTRARAAVVDATSAAAFGAAASQSPLVRGLVRPEGAVERGPFPATPAHPDDAAVWLFSGGTTGRPKAVVQPGSSFLNTTRLYAHGTMGYTADDVTLSVPKLYFGYATGSNLLFPFSVGATSILFPERPTPERLFALCAAHRPTILVNVPTMIGRMLAAEGGDLSSLRAVTSAGEALPEALYHRFRERFGVDVLDGLGTAEMWHIFLSNAPGDVRPGTLGKAVPGFEVRVCDDDGRALPDGEVGYLWVRGGSRALGYVQAHARSCAAFRGEWYASADMVRRDADGTFTYCGRSDDMLKVGGKWLAPQEVEGCLAAHPGVAECAVLGVPDASGLVKPVAFVRPGEPVPSEDELKAWVRERLEPYKAPRRVVFLETFPRTHLGKIDRGKLRGEHTEP